MQSIEVHPLTENPTRAWEAIRKNQKYVKLKTKPPAKPQSDRQARFVCMSDTHSLIHDITFEIPDGDVFIHAGNFTKGGDIEEVENFNTWLGKFFLLFYLKREENYNAIVINHLYRV